MKEIIEQFLAENQTEEAINELTKHSSEAILLLARFKSGKKQYTMGVCSFEEWQRVEAGIRMSVLDLAESVAKKQQQNADAIADAGISSSGIKAFISYNHLDKEQARAVRAALEKNGIAVTIDEADLDAGENIENFINESLKKVNCVVSLVSKNSLQSTWVSTESTMGILLQKATDKKFIPVSLDKAVFDANFYFDSIDAIEIKVKEARANVAKALERGISPRPFQDELNRFEDAKNHLGQIIENLKAVLIVDISGDAFEAGMAKVVERALNAD